MANIDAERILALIADLAEQAREARADAETYKEYWMDAAAERDELRGNGQLGAVEDNF